MNSMKLILPCALHMTCFRLSRNSLWMDWTEEITVNYFFCHRVLDSQKLHSDIDSIKVANVVTCNDMFRKYACYKIPNKNMWKFFLSKRKLDSVYLICKLKLLLSSFCKCYCSVKPLEGFTSKFNEDRPKECNKSLINITDIELTWLKRTESVYRKE